MRPVRFLTPFLRSATSLQSLLILLAGLLFSSLIACGGGERGSTSCGVQTCQAGQFCLNLACVPGCQSNANCASDQTCEGLSGSNPIGACQNKEAPEADMMSTQPVITDPRCKTMFDKLVQCGLFTWDEGVAAQSLCSKLSAQQLQTLSDCATAWDCSGSTTPVCLGSICGGKYGCRPLSGMNLRCVDHACVF